MLAIEVSLLTGRYGATTYNVRSEAEWPPHPGRLFSALVHAWADSDEPDPGERAALLWLEQQPPPQIGCSGADEIARRRSVTVYVPGNDPSSLPSQDSRSKKAAARHAATERLRTEPSPKNEKAAARALAEYRAAVATAAGPNRRAPTAELAVLPELRNRQPRQFPTVRPDDPHIQFVWPAAEPGNEVRAALDGLLARIARLGHSSTHVSCRVTTEPGEAPRLVPSDGGRTTLRVPRVGLLDALEREFARHQGIRERQMPAAFATYGPPTQEVEPPPAGLLSGDWFLLAISPDSGTPPLGLPRSLELTRAVRDAIVAAHPAAEPFITGRFADGRGRPHLAVVPLADVGHRWATNIVRGVTLVLPRETDPTDRDAVCAALRAWEITNSTVNLADGSTVVLEPATRIPAGTGGPSAIWADVPYALRRSTWCRPSRRWTSITPVALDHHVRGLHRGAGTADAAANEHAAQLIARACRFAGFPDPVAVTTAPGSTVGGIPRAAGADRRRAFPPFVAALSGTGRQSTHASITFDREVAGPVLLGAGRYLGRGLFLPADQRKGRP